MPSAVIILIFSAAIVRLQNSLPLPLRLYFLIYIYKRLLDSGAVWLFFVITCLRNAFTTNL